MEKEFLEKLKKCIKFVKVGYIVSTYDEESLLNFATGERVEVSKDVRDGVEELWEFSDWLENI